MTRTSRATLGLLGLIYLGFVSLGLPDGTFGVAWTRLHVDLGLPVGWAGPIVLGVTVLAALSSFLSGAVIRRLSVGPVVTVSCAMTGGAMLLISHAAGLAWLVVAAFPLGLGAGAVDAGLNGYVARHYEARHMNWLHACWGVGATMGPLVMSRAIASGAGWRIGYGSIAAAQLTLAVVFVVTLHWWRAVPERQVAASPDVTTDRPAAASARQPSTGANSEAGALSVVAYAIYVAIEQSVGLWLATYLVAERATSPGTAGLAVTAYFAAITTGRLVTGFLVGRWGNRRLVKLGLLLAAAGGAAVCLPVATPVALIGVILLGAGFAPVYPGLMHEVPRRFAPTAVQTIIGRQIGGAYVGGAIMPALAGWLVQNTGALTVLVIVAVGAMVLWTVVWRLDRIS